jgi:DNA-binding transcriptional LysR family regulator
MRVTLRQLNVFEAVAKKLSYTRAAESMHLSQPAVSMQIRQLEEEIGLELFEKLGKKIQLTEAGRELFHYSEVINLQLREAEEVLESLKGISRGRLKVAVASTVNYFAPRLLAAFSKCYPGVNLHLDVTNREALVRLLEENEADVVLMGQPPKNLDLISEPFMDNPLVAIAPPGHCLAKTKNISLERLAEEVFVVREPGSGTRQAMERFFLDKGLQLRQGMEMTRAEAIKQAVRAGLGLGVVSIHTVELEMETGRLVLLDVAGFPIKRQWFLVYRRGKRLSPVAEAFRSFVINESANI